MTHFEIEEVCECGWPWFLSITKEGCLPQICCGGKKVEKIKVSKDSK